MLILMSNQKIPVEKYSTPEIASKSVAKEVAALIQKNNSDGKNTVLGLATGSTPLHLYKELIRIHKEDGLSFKNTITFNLDDYYPISQDDPESYYYFMQQHFIKHIDILPENFHIPDSNMPRESIEIECAKYEQTIKDSGGIDIQILGIGRTGHIGFNEPGSSRDSRTRLVELDKITRDDACSNFNSLENTPKYSLTMGVATIMEAKKIILMAWGKSKSEIIAKVVKGSITNEASASFLQSHPNAKFVLDKDSVSRL